MIFRNLFTVLLVAAGVCMVPAAAAQSTKATPPKPATVKAIFAGGCFWCVEEAFDKVSGVIATTSGYTGGRTRNPTYEQVSADNTGHAEAVLVEYVPGKVNYEKLVDVFWRNIDPTQRNGQFCDHGSSYRSAIFYLDEDQRRVAEASKSALVKNKPFRGEIVTEITRASEFYPAEGYHQDYYQRNPIRYKFYKTGCGREARLKQLWERTGS